jgi:hypothetical protein
VAAGTNHTAPSNQTINISASFFPAKKAFNDMTWADIQTVV